MGRKDLKLVRCPRSLAATHHGFAFYVAAPIRSIRPRPEETGFLRSERRARLRLSYGVAGSDAATVVCRRHACLYSG